MMTLNTKLLRRFVVGAAVCLGLVATAGLSTVVAQTKVKAVPPVLVTSLGQSLDGFQVQLAVRRAGGGVGGAVGRVNFRSLGTHGTSPPGKRLIFLKPRWNLYGRRAPLNE